jgi:hypothetical protein
LGRNGDAVDRLAREHMPKEHIQEVW